MTSVLSNKHINVGIDGWYTVQLGKNINKVLPINAVFELEGMLAGVSNFTSETGGCVYTNKTHSEIVRLEDETFLIKDVRLVVLEASEINNKLPMYIVIGSIKPLDTKCGKILAEHLENKFCKVSFRLNGICHEEMIDNVTFKTVSKINGWDFIIHNHSNAK